MLNIMEWLNKNIPDQSGKIAIVTGANSGIGYEVTRMLAEKGATVVMACRDLAKGRAAMSTILEENPTAELELMHLNLASLESVGNFADQFSTKFDRLNILCNNAGLMAIPYLQTEDGFEMQFGVNHLGHFALTGWLSPIFSKTAGSRVVNVSSGAHMMGKIEFERLNPNGKYNAWRAYAQSKLANLLFAYELNRRFQEHHVDAISLGAHPGYASTNLQSAAARIEGSRAKANMMNLANRLFAQSAEMGALPILYACASPQVNGCDYIGPDGWLGQRGLPTKLRSSQLAYDPVLAERLWDVSEQLTGVKYVFQPISENMNVVQAG